jgi:hypothetical protein
MTERHPSVAQVIRFFEYNHLPEPLFTVAHRCGELKDYMLAVLEDDPELTVGLRKLLEAKDCFVRAAVAQENKRKGELAEGKPLSRPNHVTEG